MKPWKKLRKRDLYREREALNRECDARAKTGSAWRREAETRDQRVKDLQAELRDARRSLDMTDRFSRERSETIASLRKDLDTANHEIKILRAAPGSGLLAAANDREKANVEIIEGLRRKLKEERAAHEENERLFRANEAAQETIIARERAAAREVQPMRKEIDRLALVCNQRWQKIQAALDLIQAPEAIPDTATGVDLAAYLSDLLARVAVILRGE